MSTFIFQHEKRVLVFQAELTNVLVITGLHVSGPLRHFNGTTLPIIIVDVLT